MTSKLNTYNSILQEFNNQKQSELIYLQDLKIAKQKEFIEFLKCSRSTWISFTFTLALLLLFLLIMLLGSGQ